MILDEIQTGFGRTGTLWAFEQFGIVPDILLLGKSFLNDFCKENRMPQVTLSKDACSFMLDYDWPGNIRELKAVIERAALMAEDNIITVEDLTFVSA